MVLPVILVTGANGQLGSAIKKLSAGYPQYAFIFPGREELPVQEAARVQAWFDGKRPAFCINCAAYTAVDRAETERDTAMLVNGTAAGILAAACKSTGTKFIHISTDYVFDGKGSEPYKEEDATSPVNYYGATKLKGEELCMKNNSDSVIIRTSWVYSEYGNNFVKTMMRLMKERPTLNVVNDQLGSPTCALDLASLLLSIVESAGPGVEKWVPGIYHFSNDGVISWYDFAVAIKKLTGSNCAVHPVSTAMYPTPAKRPAYSVFNTNKVKSTYHIAGKNWLTSLSEVIDRLKSTPGIA